MQSTFTPGRAGFRPLCRWVRGLTDTFLLGWVLAMLVSGCVTYSRDKAVLNMSDEERTMLARLDTIKKGMTKAEVQAILGPGSPLGKNALDYYLGPKRPPTRSPCTCRPVRFLLQTAALCRPQPQ
jgi:hypothetical protein